MLFIHMYRIFIITRAENLWTKFLKIMDKNIEFYGQIMDNCLNSI